MIAKIQTRHPQAGKSGKNIDRQKYDAVREAILEALKGRELTHGELMERIARTLRGRLEGNPHWYGETVKLDLEARRVIARTESRPTRYRRVRRA